MADTITRVLLNSGIETTERLCSVGAADLRFAQIAEVGEGPIPWMDGWFLSFFFDLDGRGKRVPGAAFFQLAPEPGLSKKPPVMAMACWDAKVSAQAWANAASSYHVLESVLRAMGMWMDMPKAPPTVPWLVVWRTPFFNLVPSKVSSLFRGVERGVMRALIGPGSAEPGNARITPPAPDAHRAVAHFNRLAKRFPALSRQVDTFLSGRGRDLPDWPAWCLLPMAAWMAIATGGREPSGGKFDPMRNGQIAADMQQLAAIGAWRYSQGIYRVDADLLASLQGSVVKGSLPSEVLFRLPEWSLYVETLGACFTLMERITR